MTFIIIFEQTIQHCNMFKKEKNMKSILRYSLIFLAVVIVFPTAMVAQKKSDQKVQTSHKIEKATLSVTGMSCQKGCSDGIDKQLLKTYGIVKSKTSFDKSKTEVSFDPQVITLEEIITIIEDRGYKAKKIKK